MADEQILINFLFRFSIYISRHIKEIAKQKYLNHVTCAVKHIQFLFYACLTKLGKNNPLQLANIDFPTDRSYFITEAFEIYAFFQNLINFLLKPSILVIVQTY